MTSSQLHRDEDSSVFASVADGLTIREDFHGRRGESFEDICKLPSAQLFRCEMDVFGRDFHSVQFLIESTANSAANCTP